MPAVQIFVWSIAQYFKNAVRSKKNLTERPAGNKNLSNKFNLLSTYAAWHEICYIEYTFLSFADSLLH
jgi:hypothetical protein